MKSKKQQSKERFGGLTKMQEFLYQKEFNAVNDKQHSYREK
ncbi:hypothetical protein [Fictibacillus gelatini]|nr:hypothetical protein [Fictibacillus gelatini]